MRTRLFYFIALLLVMPVASVVYAAEPYNINRVRRSFDPNPVTTGDQSTVSLAVSGDQCIIDTNAGASVMLVLDRSGSMNSDRPSRMSSAVEASKLFVNRVRIEGNDELGVASFTSRGRVDASLGSSRNVVNAALDNLVNAATGTTSVGTGIRAARGELGGARDINSKALVVLSDGKNNNQSRVDLMVSEARAACDAGYALFTVGVAENPNDVDPELASIVCGGGFYREVSAPIDQDILNAIYGEIADQVLGPIATNISITDQVPAGLTVSNISDGGWMTGNVISWQFNELVNNKTVEYNVTGAVGSYTFNSGKTASTQCNGTNTSLPAENGTLRIIERPTDVPPRNAPTPYPTGVPPTPYPTGIPPTPYPTGVPPTPLPVGPWPTAIPTGVWPTEVRPTTVPVATIVPTAVASRTRSPRRWLPDGSPTAIPATDTPATSVPSTSVPPTSVPPTSVPPTAVPPPPPPEIPEPITIILFGGGAAAVGAYARERRRNEQDDLDESVDA